MSLKLKSHQGIEDKPTRGSMENIQARTSADSHFIVAHDGEKAIIVNIEDASPSLATTPLDHEGFPDGGLRAWLVVFGAICNTFSTFGYINSWGVFQAYYELTLLHDKSPSSIAWIGSIQYSLIFFPGLFVGRLFDLGYFRVPLALASVVLVVATFLVAHCTQYWHFLLCQGLAIGLASGTMFGPAMGVIAHWFKKKRGVALGLMACGSSFGGAVFPITARKLIPKVGFPWTMRILGFILILTLGLANLTVRSRLPPKNAAGGLFNLRAFKSAPYTVWCASTLTMFLGLYTMLTYIDISSTEAGISPDFSFYLVAIANASSAIGRYAAGAVSDRFGPINTMAPLTLLAAVLTYVWPFARSQGALTAISIIYGIATGSYVALIAAPLMAFGDTADVGRRVGMSMTILGFGALIGPPISGAINSATGGFEAVGFYAGSMIMLAVLMGLITRHLVLGKLWGKF